MRNESTLAALVDRRLANLVHASVRGDPDLVGRHATFIAARLCTLAVALSTLPALILACGTLAPAQTAAVGALLLSVAAIFVLLRSGQLPLAQVIASAGLRN